MTRMSSLPTAWVVLALLSLGACRQTPAGPQAQPQPSRAVGPTREATRLTPDDPRMLRFHKVDMLVAQWDVAQASARSEQAGALAAQIRNEVDPAFGDFVTAASGAMGMRLQYVAVSGLGFSGRSEATSVLLDQLAGTDPQLVGNVLIALKLRADPDTPLAPLLKMATTNATAPRRYAPLTIANVVDARWRTGRSVDPAMQRTATHVLSGVVADRDPFVRLHVAKALGALRGPGCYDLLMILMHDEQIRIRLAAAAGLERIGDPRGFPEVIRLLDDLPEDTKPTVRDLLASYAQRLQGGPPLTQDEILRRGVSAHAWTRWFNDYAASRGLHIAEGVAPGRPPGAASFPPAGPTTSSSPFPPPGAPSPSRAPSPFPPVAAPPAGTSPSPLAPPTVRRASPPPPPPPPTR